MKNLFALRLRAALLGALLAMAGAAQAVTVHYESVDLPDLIVGEDLWRYDYRVTGGFEPFGGFNLLYDPARYGALSDAQPSASTDWDVFVIQPDAALPAPGLFTATRLTAGAALNDPFAVQFVWLGAGTPGAQPFEVFNASFDVTERGATQAIQAVPEPQTYALFALGLFVLAARLSRR